MEHLEKEKVCNMYRSGKSMREIAIELNTNHKLISRVLKSQQIETRPPLNLRGKTKYNNAKDRLYGNMLAHLRYNVTIEWLMQFDDIEKLKYLNRSFSRGRDCDFNTETYMLVIEKFYNDDKFNKLYEKWITTKDKWIKPSLDHIHPKSKGGTKEGIDNFRFISWLENRAKADIMQEDWNEIKKRIYDYL